MTMEIDNIDNSVIVDQLIRKAMDERRRLKLRLYGLSRIVEPFEYGIRKRERQLLAYQVGGESRSGDLPDWRWIKLEQATEIEVLDEPFGDERPSPKDTNFTWDRLLVRLDD